MGAAMLPRQGLEYYAPRVPGESLTKYGFVSYLKDMVVAPEPVLAYMCQNVSVFFAYFSVLIKQGGELQLFSIFKNLPTKSAIIAYLSLGLINNFNFLG